MLISMLSKLLLATMVANAPIQEYTTPRKEANQTQIKTNTIGWTRVGSNEYGYEFYYQNWSNHYDTGEYEIYSVACLKNDEYSTRYDTTIQYYFKIKKHGQIIPNNNLTISVNNTLQGENAQTILRYKAETDSYDYIDQLDRFLDIDYCQNNTENHIDFFDERLYTNETNLVYDYDYFIEENTTNVTVNYVETDGWYSFAWAVYYTNDTQKEYFSVNLNEITYDYTIYVATQEVIDLPGLMLTILGMPFSFISQAFNLTLFPGTQYSINVSNLIFAVIAALMIIIIFRKILK